MGGAGSCAQGPQEGREGLKRGSAPLHVRMKKMGLPALWLSWDSQLEGNCFSHPRNEDSPRRGGFPTALAFLALPTMQELSRDRRVTAIRMTSRPRHPVTDPALGSHSDQRCLVILSNSWN